MATRKNLQHSEDIRQKIRGSQLVNFIQDHIFNDRPASKTQMVGALGLLKKIVPDLQAVQATHSGPNGQPIQISSVDAEL